jgi:TIGR03009 family protein
MLLRQHILLLCVVVLATPSVACPQNAPRNAADRAGRAEVQNPRPNRQAQAQRLSPAMEQLLVSWANASSKIERFEGEHLRRVYDSVFEVERLSEGQFWYESPDKGRIDVLPTAITQAMKDERDAPDARVRRKKETGKPYDLVSGKPEKWICDGVRVFEVDVEKKTAQVAQLPPSMQGVSIMDSPLPFLFGMPPDKAKERFRLSFSRPFDQKTGRAYITALPRKEQDAASWSQADVILDLRTFLPIAIQLKDPPGTGVTVYSFRDLHVNKSNWLKTPAQWMKNRFEPDLRMYHVINIDAAPGQRVAEGPGGARPGVMPPVVPNYVGVPFQKAVDSLKQMGLTKEDKKVFIYKGTAARKPGDVFNVQSQKPAAGTPINARTVVELTLWIK